MSDRVQMLTDFEGFDRHTLELQQSLRQCNATAGSLPMFNFNLTFSELPGIVPDA